MGFFLFRPSLTRRITSGISQKGNGFSPACAIEPFFCHSKYFRYSLGFWSICFKYLASSSVLLKSPMCMNVRETLAAPPLIAASWQRPTSLCCLRSLLPPKRLHRLQGLQHTRLCCLKQLMLCSVTQLLSPLCPRTCLPL